MIRENKLKQKINNGEFFTISYLRFANPSLAEIMVMAGVEYVVIDNAHYPFDPETIQHIIRAVQAQGGYCGVRVPRIDASFIGQLLDMGADGIHAPCIETYEEARSLVDAVMFAPQGKRGFCPITRGANYGFGLTYAEVAEHSNANTIIAIQIETKTGIENAEQICSIREIDMIRDGASDLAASYGFPGQNNHPVVLAALEKLSNAVTASGRKRHEVSGYCGSDQQILMAEFAARIKAFRERVL